MDLQKKPPLRSEKYLKFVRSLPRRTHWAEQSEAHHIKGYGKGGRGIKASDYFTLPLSTLEHKSLHDNGFRTWESKYGSQWRFIGRTLIRAIRERVIRPSPLDSEERDSAWQELSEAIENAIRAGILK